ncbi:hypothetical protein N478_13815 [Pseudoalteromonas luteoviolacea S4060-1]|uniref:Uncharacterized protein n=1 Tax=Pseudoalteromonas luteoviolacea S4060-1 TaxID=1365257 RepID=A0A167NSW6_9GAMM|nr:hypothetical protein N478_13815 [Pseudoalteromonas luteoviolacea S4060-1]
MVIVKAHYVEPHSTQILKGAQPQDQSAIFFRTIGE